MPQQFFHLQNILSKEYFGDEKTTKALSSVAELAISETDIHTVQQYIKDYFDDIFNITQLSKCIAANLYVDYGTGYEECCINKKVYILVISCCGMI